MLAWRVGRLLLVLRPALGRELPARPPAVFFFLPLVVYLALLPWNVAAARPTATSPTTCWSPTAWPTTATPISPTSTAQGARSPSSTGVSSRNRATRVGARRRDLLAPQRTAAPGARRSPIGWRPRRRGGGDGAAHSATAWWTLRLGRLVLPRPPGRGAARLGAARVRAATAALRLPDLGRGAGGPAGGRSATDCALAEERRVALGTGRWAALAAGPAAAAAAQAAPARAGAAAARPRLVAPAGAPPPARPRRGRPGAARRGDPRLQPMGLRQRAEDPLGERFRAPLAPARQLRDGRDRALLRRRLRPLRRGAALAAAGACRRLGRPPRAPLHPHAGPRRRTLPAASRLARRVVWRLVAAVSLRRPRAAAAGARPGATAGAPTPGRGPFPDRSARRRHAGADPRLAGGARLDLQPRRRRQSPARCPREQPPPRRAAPLPERGATPAGELDRAARRQRCRRAALVAPAARPAHRGRPRHRRPAAARRGGAGAGCHAADAGGRVRGRLGGEDRGPPAPRALDARTGTLPRQLGAHGGQPLDGARGARRRPGHPRAPPRLHPERAGASAARGACRRAPARALAPGVARRVAAGDPRSAAVAARGRVSSSSASRASIGAG